MFPFSRDPKDPQPAVEAPAPKPAETHPLDALTGGVFSAATSGERAQRVRDWLATEPTPEHMQEVFKELSSKDKGAAKALREKIDELRRAKGQDAVAAEWQAKAQTLLDAARLNIADALAWQRDAAKAGAPLSREPLAGLRTQLVERIKATPPVPGSFHPATGSLAEALAASPPPDPDFDSEAWNRDWAKIEDEIRRINREDDIAEGRG